MVFGAFAERFADIRAELADQGAPPDDRDAFLLSREGVGLLRDLRPPGSPEEGLAQLIAVTHAAYLFWLGGGRTFRLSDRAARSLLEAPPSPASEAGAPVPACYIQVPDRLVWAQVVPGNPPEPLDGMFLCPLGDAVRLVAIFGLHPARGAMSVVEVTGTRQDNLERQDGSPLFSPLLAGGDRARVHSLAGAEELLELGWRTAELVSAKGGNALAAVLEID